MTPLPPETLDPWRAVAAARLPGTQLVALAPVRDQLDIRVFRGETDVWVRFPAGRAAVVRCLLGMPGVELFTQRGNDWVRLGSRLPTSAGPPAGDSVALDGLLTPARFQAAPPPAGAGPRHPLRLVRAAEPRAVTALRCGLHRLANWADTATPLELAGVRAARCGGRAVLLGAKLPVVPGSVRYWGDDLLIPIGFRTDPDLPTGALRSALGVDAEELALLDDSGVEAVPRAAFEPLTRAGLRLALRQPAVGGGVP